MGLFGRKKPANPVAASTSFDSPLPEAKAEDWTPLNLPSLDTMYLLNIGWVKRSTVTGRSTGYWVSTISEIRYRFGERTFIAIADPLLKKALAITPDEYLPEAFQMDAFEAATMFGLLAGTFERESGQAREGECHPAMWNTMIALDTRIAETRGTSQLRPCLMHAGYVKGRNPEWADDMVLSRWNS